MYLSKTYNGNSSDLPLCVVLITLSKHATLILPHVLILGGLIQNILSLFNRLKLYITATLIAAGNAGGTTIVIISNARMIISDTSDWNQHEV